MLAFSPDSTKLATSGGTVHVWQVDSGTEIAGDVTQAGTLAQPIAWNAEGTRLAVGRMTGLVGVLDLKDSRWVNLDGNGMVRALPMPDGDARTVILSRRTNQVTTIAYAPDGKRIITGSNTSVGVWDAEQKRLTDRLSGHAAKVVGVAVDRAGQIFSVDTEGQLKIWPGAMLLARSVLPGIPTLVPMAISANGSGMAVAHADFGLYAWDLRDLRRITLLHGTGFIDRSRGYPADQPSSTGLPSTLAMTPDGRFLLTGGMDSIGTVRTWSVETGESTAQAFNQEPAPDCRPISGTFTGRISDWQISPDAGTLAFRQGSCLVVRDRSSTRLLAVWRGFNGGCDFRPDGTLTLSTYDAPAGVPTANGRVLIWDWRRGKVTASVALPATSDLERRAWRLAVGALGSRIALVNVRSSTAIIFTGDLGREVSRFAIPTDTKSFALSADGERLATSATDTTIRIWDTTRRQLLLVLEDDDHHDDTLVFTPDGRLIAERAAGGVTIWDSKRRQLPAPK
jgi:WD40 repeat protein